MKALKLFFAFLNTVLTASIGYLVLPWFPFADMFGGIIVFVCFAILIMSVVAGWMVATGGKAQSIKWQLLALSSIPVYLFIAYSLYILSQIRI